MRFDDDQESSNIEDRRGGGGLPIGGGIGVGTIVLALAAWYFGIDPSVVTNGSRMQQQGEVVDAPRPVEDANPEERELRQFVGRVLRSTETTWHELFAAGGAQYVEPRLVLFRNATATACGTGQAAMGPFYCPADQRVYIDLAFYDELRSRFKAPGDFAQAYVIAHEVGHHVQHLLGISAKVQQMRQRLGEREGNGLSVRLELQADCFAGVWAHHARIQLEPGDVEEALTAATAIGDDTLQKRTQGHVVPESFTHGSAAQRTRWFKRGLEQGSVEGCNTFARGAL